MTPGLQWATPAVVAALVVVGAVRSPQSPAVAVVLAAVGVVAAALVSRRDRVAVGAALVVTAVVGALCADTPSNLGLFAMCLLVAWGAFTHGWPVALALGLASYAVLVVGVLVSEDGGWGAWFAATVITGVVGVLVRRDRLLLEALRAAQADLATQAALAERHRIARELHDVIGHALTVSALHVSSARLALDDEPDQARAALEEAERLAQQSLAEVRSAVGLVRDGSPSTTPLPGAADLDELVASFRRAGADVAVEVTGDLGDLTATGGLTVYRIVQEALTNVVRHAPGRRAVVRVAVAGAAATVVVDSDGPPSPTWRTTAGAGLAGMRERAEALGGRLTAGPVGPGGTAWRVEAELPA